MLHSKKWLVAIGFSALGACVLVTAPSARAEDDGTSGGDASSAQAKETKTEVPVTAFTYAGGGVSKGSYGAMATGLGVGGKGADSVVGGGGTIWGSPIDRLTIIGDAQRNVVGNFAPSALAMVRLFGKVGDGLAISALGKFKIDGFAVGPNKEVEAEIESGLAVSYNKAGWHADVNGIGGVGTGDDREVDAEARLRLGRDIADSVRLGVDGQARYRLHGTFMLPGDRKGDFFVGPQVLVGASHFFGAITAGPTTMGLATSGVGYMAVVSVGGVSF